MATVAMTIGSVGVEVSPAHAASAVRDSAFGYYAHVSSFGGPCDLRGCATCGVTP